MELTSKQKAFADAYLAGATGSDSYRTAYNTKGNNRAVARKAVTLLTNPKVIAYLDQMRAELKKSTILDKQKSLERLTGIAQNDKATHRDQIAAVKQLSRMLGFDAPQKIEAKVEGSLLYRIRKGKTS